MLLTAMLTIACLGTPQGGGDPPALLTPAEQKSLQAKLAKYVETQTAYDAAGSNDKQREKLLKDYNKARDAFNTEWEGRMEKKGNLLGSMHDLQAVFANCLSYERKPALSFRKVDAKDGIPAFDLSVPKNYRAEMPTRTVLLLPGLDEKNQWIDGRRWFEMTWDKSASVNDVIFHVSIVAPESELDPVPDYSRSSGEEEENGRIKEVLQSYGETKRQYNVDRSRLVLDAGKGACAFGVRLATHFPEVFAGLVLRHPTSLEGIRLGSITGLPILLLSSAATADACKEIKTQLEQLDPKQCTILETTDAYPFKGATADIEKWMAGVQRVVNRSKVVIEPNHDRFTKAFWVAIDTMDALQTAAPDKKPRVEAIADRAQNRITIKAVGVEGLTLQLNDALVDLSKDFTVIVNDKAVTEKRNRDFNRMFEYMMMKYDSDFLFPVQFRVRVPKGDDKPAEAGDNK